MIPLVVAWFCECGSIVRMSFCAAHLSVTACAGAPIATAIESSIRIKYMVSLLKEEPIIHGRRRFAHETDPDPDRVLRSRRLPVFPGSLQAAGDQDAARRGARALCAAASRERAREDGRRRAHEFRGAHVQRA